MEFDLAKAIVYRQARKGKRFHLSPELLAMVNERIDRLQAQQAGQPAATERRETAQGAGNGSAGPSAMGV